MSNDTILGLPALTSEDIEVPLIAWASDPALLTWQGLVSDTFETLEGGSPSASAFSSATAVNRGTSAAPDWRIQVRVNGLSAGLYGVWVRVNGAAGASPVRYAGRLRLY